MKSICIWYSKKIISSAAYGSNKKINIKIRPLKDLKRNFNYPNLFIIHTAFITREKISYGQNYIYLNKEISNYKRCN